LLYQPIERAKAMEKLLKIMTKKKLVLSGNGAERMPKLDKLKVFFPVLLHLDLSSNKL